MFARTTLAVLAVTISVSANATPDLVSLGESRADASYLNRSSIQPVGELVEATVFRVFDQTIGLADGAPSGAHTYPHQSVKAVYSVNCISGELALIEWTMFRDMFGSNGVIWSDKASFAHFASPADNESRHLVSSVCATRTAER